jgi:signal transduction histidine kinase
MDPLTASVALSIAQLCIAVILAGLYFAAPAERYMRYWAMSGLLSSVGVSILLVSAASPLGLLLAAGNISLFSSCVVVWMGLRNFFGQDAAREGYLLIALFSLLYFLLLLSDAGFTTRAYLSSAGLIVVFVLCLKTVRTRAAIRTEKKRSFARGLASIGLLLLIGAHVARVVILLRDPVALRPGAISHFDAVILYLVPLAGILLFFSALPLLYFERIKNALVHALSAKHDALEVQLRFVDMFSHEYRTPLAIIRTNLDILQCKDQSAGNRLGSNLAKMRRAVMRLVEVAETALTPERMEDGQLDIQREAIVLPDFLAAVTEEAVEFWSERAPQVRLGEMPLVAFDGDARLLKTALLNLLDNAIKYAPRHSIVSVTLKATDGMLALTVSDNGPGIPEQELNLVFGKYFRGSRSVHTPGSGVGLYLVQCIIEQHGGSISLANRPAGGVVATITLPFPIVEIIGGRARH